MPDIDHPAMRYARIIPTPPIPDLPGSPRLFWAAQRYKAAVGLPQDILHAFSSHLPYPSYTPPPSKETTNRRLCRLSRVVVGKATSTWIRTAVVVIDQRPNNNKA
jgi:hypothetical protein